MLGVSPSKFWMNFILQKLQSWEYPPACDRQTDGQTDICTMAGTTMCKMAHKLVNLQIEINSLPDKLKGKCHKVTKIFVPIHVGNKGFQIKTKL